jgi:hypothetical protein
LSAVAQVGRAARGPGGRPRSELRSVIVKALEEGPPMTLREVAARCQVGYEATRWTLKRLVRASAVEIVGREKRAHCKKWVALYDIARTPECEQSPVSPAAELAIALAQWCA